MTHSGRMTLALLWASLSGCAWSIYGRYHTVHVTDPNHSADHVEITNRIGDFVYQGPAETSPPLRRSAGYFRREHYRVAFCDADDRVVHSHTIRFRISKVYWSNFAQFVPIGLLIVDPCTGGMWVSKDTLIVCPVVLSDSIP